MTYENRIFNGRARPHRAAPGLLAAALLSCLLGTPTSAAAAGADLIVTEVAVDTTATSGAAAVRVTIRNVGAYAAGASRGRLVSSYDAVLNAGDVTLATFEVPPLTPGAQASTLLRVQLPTGVLYLIAIADSDATEAESSEANNLRARPRNASDPFSPAGVLRVCPTCPDRLLSTAAARVAEGQIILIDPAPVPMLDCALITKSNITLRGVLDAQGRRPVIGDKSCRAKGVIVLENAALANLTVEGLELRGATVPDGNGAAIRFQGFGLTVRNVYIHDNENGILTSQGGPAGAGTLKIEHSLFIRNGSPLRPGKQHNVYISGGVGSALQFAGNLSLAAVGEGHELKSRAATNTLMCNVLANLDSADSYTIDISQAGRTTIQDNVLQQGPLTSNKAMFNYGRDAELHADRTFMFARNVIVDDKTGGYFFALGSGTRLSLAGDVLIGSGALVATGPAPVSNTSQRYASRAAYRSATGKYLPDWSTSLHVLPDLPAQCARVHPRRCRSLSDFVAELETGTTCQ